MKVTHPFPIRAASENHASLKREIESASQYVIDGLREGRAVPIVAGNNLFRLVGFRKSSLRSAHEWTADIHFFHEEHRGYYFIGRALFNHAGKKITGLNLLHMAAKRVKG